MVFGKPSPILGFNMGEQTQRHPALLTALLKSVTPIH